MMMMMMQVSQTNSLTHSLDVLFFYLLMTAVGIHLLDPDETPATRADWLDPVLAFCSHANKIVAFEPMFPFRFNHGDEAHFYERDEIELVDQTIVTLPTYYSLDYNPTTGVTTVVVKGQAGMTQAEYLALTTVVDDSGAASHNNYMIALVAMMAVSAFM